MALEKRGHGVPGADYVFCPVCSYVWRLGLLCGRCGFDQDQQHEWQTGGRVGRPLVTEVRAYYARMPDLVEQLRHGVREDPSCSLNCIQIEEPRMKRKVTGTPERATPSRSGIAKRVDTPLRREGLPNRLRRALAMAKLRRALGK